MINPAFRNINRLFVLSFENGNNNPTRDSSDKHYMPLVEITNFNVLIEKKNFFFLINQYKTNKHDMKILPKCQEKKIIQ